MNPFITKAEILRKFKSLPEFAAKARMTKQALYFIVDNEYWGYTKRSRETYARLRRILDRQKDLPDKRELEAVGASAGGLGIEPRGSFERDLQARS